MAVATAQTSQPSPASHEHAFAHPIEHAEFIIDAVLFDMDGTLVDSIGAVEAAWGGVAKELGQDPDEVIAATHGRRAIDNLRDLKPHLRKKSDADMNPHVEEFETRILNNADEYGKEVRSRRESEASSRRSSRAASRRASQAGSRRPSQPGSGMASPAPGEQPGSRRGSFANELTRRMAILGFSSMPNGKSSPGSESPRRDPTGAKAINGSSNGSDKVVADKLVDSPTHEDDNPFDDDDDEEIDIDAIEVDTSDLTDNSVKILPGVRKLFDSCPLDRVAVATSGAKTYCHGALKRAGIQRPKVTVTAEDPRIKNGKPAPDPFLLAAADLGFDCKNCLVFEDSPSGLRAGIASGATTIGVCTSHPIEKIKDVGAHYLVPTLECVSITQMEDGRLLVKIDADLARRTPAHVPSATDLTQAA